MHGTAPFARNPLVTRQDVQQAVRQLFTPLLPHFSNGGAQLRLGSRGVLYGAESEALEGFARPLFGLVPLAMGGGDFEHWGLYRKGLANGTDPAHPEYWGQGGTDQRMVERAALAFAVAFVPELVWEPLSRRQRGNLVRFLSAINHHPLPDCNWHFFRVLVNLALERVGQTPHAPALEESLERLEMHYDAEGYYHDGKPGRIDYYVPWAYHTYGLMIAAARWRDDLAMRYRERAGRFAASFQYWFDQRGRGVPFGRSQIYRFAQGSLWSALVFADEQALPWPRIKGLLLRHLRHWSRQRIFDRDGVLNLGYAYDNPAIAEPYSSCASPYWCNKAFLALAMPDSHPFWRANEESAEAFEADLDRVRPASRMGAVFQRAAGEVQLLSAGQDDLTWPQTAAKYGKFAYSSAFAFSVAACETQPSHGVHDSMLALRETTGAWRVRVTSENIQVKGHSVYSTWHPWPDVRVETLLVALGSGWHLRLHRLLSQRQLASAEQGFALGRGPSDASALESALSEMPTAALAENEFGASAVICLGSTARGAVAGAISRRGSLQQALPATHLVHPRTVIPTLEATLEPGAWLMACAVFASEQGSRGGMGQLLEDLPACPSDALRWARERGWRDAGGSRRLDE